MAEDFRPVLAFAILSRSRAAPVCRVLSIRLSSVTAAAPMRGSHGSGRSGRLCPSLINLALSEHSEPDLLHFTQSVFLWS